MNERTLSIFAGLATGLETAVTNLQNISTKKEELRVEKEKYALDKKIKDAQLKKLEFETSPEAVAEHREKFKQANQLHELNMKVKSSQINTAEINERKKEQDLRKEGELRIMAGVGTLQDLGMSEDQARSTMGSLFTPQTASVGGRQVPVAPGGFVESASAYDRGDAGIADPFLSELGRATRTKTGMTKEQAVDKLYGRKPAKEDSDAEFLQSIGIGAADTGEEITSDQEDIIQSNMDYYGKSREEVIAALKKAGKL